MASSKKDFHKRLRIAREQAGFTQTSVGEAVGVPQPTISEWETGPREPSIEQLIVLAQVLSVSTGWLVAGESSETFDSGVRAALNLVLLTAQEFVEGAQKRTEEFEIELRHADQLVRDKQKPKVLRVAEAPAVPMESETRPPQPQKGSKKGAGRAG